jgi:hypothetical protein
VNGEEKRDHEAGSERETAKQRTTMGRTTASPRAGRADAMLVMQGPCCPQNDDEHEPRAEPRCDANSCRGIAAKRAR